MKARFKDASVTYDTAPSRVRNKGLERVLQAGVVDKEGAFLLASLIPSNFDKSRYDDLTDMETTINHIHIMDYLFPYDSPTNVEAVNSLTESISYTKELQEILRNDFPEIPFRIILSNEWENPRRCTIRFYRMRDDEPQWLKIDDLEGYREEAILFLDIIEHQVG